MLPLGDVQAGVCQGQGQGSSSRLAPVPRGSLAPRAALGPHGTGLAAPRSRPLPVGGSRGGSGGARATAAGAAASAAAAAASRATPPNASGCLSRQVVDLGYDRNIEERYEWGREVGKGGNGVVRVVADRATGEEFACKALPKALPGEAPEAKRRGHIEAIKREVEVLRRLAGSLAVVRLVDVFEDDDKVYLVQEYCRGGELCHRIGDRHYSERTVASYMRAVLRTLAQCHSHHTLHRDVKPGNFMLLDDSDRAPLKAIDFGLAVPFDPEALPRDDLGFEGTPWYMAPEVLSSQVTPASDVWSAGVMAHQLLTGRLPFDDHRNPFAPSISAVWKSVLSDKVAYNMPWWSGLSDEAKDFVSSLLQRDPEKRPTAKEALKHPWLRGDSTERSAGKQIGRSVVQRIQRFAQASQFKRSVLQLIAEELLARPGAKAALAASASAQDLAARAGAAAAEGGADASAGADADADADSAAAGAPSAAAPAGVIAGPSSGALSDLFRKLSLDGGAGAVDTAAAAEALSRMGFRLRPSEAAALADTMDTSGSGKVRRAAVAASQVDWRWLQTNDVDAWLDIAARAFRSLDRDRDGVLSLDEIVASMRAKLPDDELADALAQVMAEAGGGARDGGLDFDSFLNVLKVGSMDSLDQYDARFEFASPGSLDRLQSLLDASNHGSDGSSHRGRRLRSPSPAVEEAAAPAASAGAAGEYRDKSWNQPAPNFRFDFGGWDERAAAPPAAPASAAPDHSAADGGARAWPGLTAGAPAGAAGRPAPGALLRPPAVGNGTVRGGGHFDRRMHGASLYRNQAVAGHAPPAALETVRE
ncbi:calcium-dependent kinase [Raphidocelis subcapitata]|uniref:Calcium-dependent kinase n=1 Tax=Raphidocelis subcapitata TaxID=307507 RepID=A0A2V0P1F0_9CHLO|nr:calcium-dependent kinase [Raphidocelis subcapitata]|eukprot:GBF90915.1 calcium-dependent kinase [Raphidocelis subcapitata]